MGRKLVRYVSLKVDVIALLEGQGSVAYWSEVGAVRHVDGFPYLRAKIAN